ncbi:hypothetical protein BGX26_002078 [Mortierella sp. AD094]|nr:hypothetical protein BGX26_002078 [Mortierella sp. AD094]
MHPYLFFYLLGGITFIPCTLIVTVFVLWIRLPYLDPSKPRPTDLPPPHLSQEQIEKDLRNSYGTNGLSSSSEKNSSMRRRKGVQSRSKSDQLLQPSAVSSSSSVPSNNTAAATASAPALLKSKVNNNSDSGDDEDDNDDNSESGSDDDETLTSQTHKTPTSREPDVPMQSDPNLNREGYVRMTRVPRLGPAAESISDYMTNMLFQPKNARPKDSYYAVLRYDTLFLYESDQQRDCKAVVPMNLYEVKIFPKNLPDNEVFNKEHPIQIKRKVDALASSNATNTGQDEYYIFIHTPVIKEDWYLALLYASKLRKPGTKQKIQDKAQFDLEAIQNHIRILHSDKHHENTRWFNSFIGRLFLGVYKTKKIQDVYIQKITRKTLKLKRPSFLGEIKVRSFNIGHSIPYITRTKLKDLLPNGELTAEFFLSYGGGVRVEIEVDVGLGLNSIKPVKVTIVLAVLVKSISGMMTLKVKAPPTNRFWVGFQEPPKMDIVIEPIVADKAIKLNMVISAIESKIREAMVEAIVLPNMDDTPFFDSHGTGGIFEGDEEFSPDPVDDSDVETATTTGKAGKSNSTKPPGSKRRDSESSFSSEHAPPPPLTEDRKSSWSSSAGTESDADPESLPIASTPTQASIPAPGPYLNQQNNSSAASTLSSSSLASKFKRFSQAHFSSRSSSDSVPEPPKLNTKPTVATSIATAIRTSPSSTPNFGSSSGSSSNSSKLQSVIPKLSALNDAELMGGPRIFTSSSPSNGPSKKDSTSSLRRLASLESPESEDNTETSENGDELTSPTGNDPMVQSLRSPVEPSPSTTTSLSSSSSSTSSKNKTDSMDGSSSRRKEFDTFPRSSGLEKWDTTSTISSASSSSTVMPSVTEAVKGLGDQRRNSLSSSSSRLGIAGILDPSSPPASGNSVTGASVSQMQGNIASLDKKGKKELDDRNGTGTGNSNNNGLNSNGSGSASKSDDGGQQRGSKSKDGSFASKFESVKEHGRRSNIDGLLNLKMKKDLLMKKIASRNNDEDQEGGASDAGSTRSSSSSKFSLDSVGTLLGHRRRGSVSSTKGPPPEAASGQRPISAYDPMDQESQQARDAPRRKLVRSTSAAGTATTNSNTGSPKRKEVDLYPLGRPFGNSANSGEEGGSSLMPSPAPLNGAGTTKTRLSSSSTSPSLASTSPSNSGTSSPAGSNLSAKSAYLQQKSQAALGSAKAWVKRSLEDRRLSDDDPLLTGKMRMD